MPAVAKPRSTERPQPVEGAQWIPLTQGAWALVDETDWERVLSRGPWYCSNAGYAVRIENRKPILMHRFILLGDENSILDVDHRTTGTTLDNRRLNLRLVTKTKNQGNRRPTKNRVGFKGVSIHRKTGRWRARVAGRTIGYFDIQETAARAYDRAAIEYFGDCALTNFPKESYA